MRFYALHKMICTYRMVAYTKWNGRSDWKHGQSAGVGGQQPFHSLVPALAA